MNYYIEVGYEQLNKKGEELCGDQIEIIRKKDAVIAVMSDGLGSGIKANILSTLTTKIAVTMLDMGSDLSEVVDTIANTLPICKVRDIAYSTFTIFYVWQDGKAYIAEFDNPSVFYYAKNKNRVSKLEGGKISIINDKKILEMECQLEEEDCIIATTDGVIHAGVGERLNYGWEWHHVAKYLEGICQSNNAIAISKSLISTCYDLYNEEPSDDATALTIRLKRPQTINIFTGPPLLKENDSILVKKFNDSPGKKIICGGTAANIVSKELQRTLVVDINTLTKEIPPISHMQGIDLITEGMITMDYTLRYLKEFLNNPITRKSLNRFKDKNGASILANKLLNEGTHINFFLGHSLNTVYKDNSFPTKMGRKFRIVGEIINILKRLGKTVNIYYF